MGGPVCEHSGMWLLTIQETSNHNAIVVTEEETGKQVENMVEALTFNLL